MTGCEECRELLGGLVLDALEPDEAETARRHLGACPSCAREHEELVGLPALLELAGPVGEAAEPPPARLEGAVMRRVAEDRTARRPARRTPRFPRLLRPLGGAVAGAAATAAVFLALSAGGERREVALTPSPLARGATAVAKVEPGSNGTAVRLRVDGLPAPEAGVYELWFVRGAERVSAGTFRTDELGRADVRLTSGARLEAYPRLGVTREPDAGDPARNGPNVLAGALGS